VPAAFATIFESAFSGQAATGGFLGAGMIMAVRAGVARGLFSNEAGQGSTPIAHAVAQTDDPARQGRFAMMGTFIDTLVICTATGLVMLTVQGAFPHTGPDGVQVMQEHVWTSDLRGFAMTQAAYDAAFPIKVLGDVSIGALIASVALLLFVFTTLISWGYYGERATTYLFGQKLAIPFRLIWVMMIFVGSFQEIEFIWRLGDIFNAAMALPNLIALVALSGVVFALAKGDKKAGPDHE
ncbi:MAG: alanine:cation symporter family protein, partial [Phenylobacterium sp.]|nr:alanine:cation symporter family protein [Phenylobacterium sp.]